MPFNVLSSVNTCHALGFGAFLMLDALISFRCHLRAIVRRLNARVLKCLGLLMLSTWFDSNRSGSRVRFYR